MGVAPLLVVGIGNPSRGDDALGPAFVERASAALARDIEAGDVELLTDFQLQIEHALDLAGRRRVVFVDASVRAAAPFEMARVVPRRDASPTTHALSPAAVLDAHRSLGGEPLDAWTLAIRGERFELGEPLSASASAHLKAALAFFLAAPSGSPPRGPIGRRIDVEGTVQGVGLRPWIFRTASALGVTGRVLNTASGVTVEAFGTARALDGLVEALQQRPPAAASIRRLHVAPVSGPAPETFTIAESGPGGATSHATFALPPDLAVCDACLRDVGDPGDRHHGYAFTSCTACGPRLAIALALPFDRATTTMARFSTCEACSRAYGDPMDRRFHGQTIACPACGPRLRLAVVRGERMQDEASGDDALAAAAARLRDGAILAVQGIGAFHLVCDATQAHVVAELRRRKRREDRPFAVMVADASRAREIGAIGSDAERALTSAARPIVLVPSAAGGLVAEREVNGPSSRVGVMLPHSPLYHRLLALVDRPLVVTSGNPSGGPAIVDEDEARAVLGPVVDGFLLHDRPIARRVEDSVVAVGPAGGVRVVRRSRGYAPLPVRLPAGADRPILAVGGQMKAAACVVIGDAAYLTPHLGDLSFVEGEAAWRRDVEGFERLLGVRPDVLAHDLHPEYATTRYALARGAGRRVGVQHHVAHVLAAVAELHLDDPVLGVAFDGSGWGPDGTSWGAELLLVDGLRWSRAASFRSVPLAGGERAIREVWRVALGALHEAFGEESARVAARLPLFHAIPAAATATVVRMIETGVETVAARGMGRFFDAVGALVLGTTHATFDGHVAVALEEVADDLDAVMPYPVSLPAAIGSSPVQVGADEEVDLRPTVRGVVDDLLAGRDRGLIAARFHKTIIEATAAVAERILGATGIEHVVLTGGSMQNQVIERGLAERLGRDRVRMARDVPVNDGGLALGQAWAAVLASRANG